MSGLIKRRFYLAEISSADWITSYPWSGERLDFLNSKTSIGNIEQLEVNLR